MTREEMKKQWPIWKAWSEGAQIQFRTIAETSWKDLNEDNINVFQYRIKPKLQYRPWKPEEVPVGALYKWHDVISVILATGNGRLYFINYSGEITSNFLDAGVMAESSKYSTDNGKTWQPCGVLV